MKIKSKIQILALITLLVFSTSACRLAKMSQLASPTPEPIPVSKQAVEELEKNIGKLAENFILGGPIQLTVTEEQLTSVVYYELQDAGETQVKDIQVYLRDGLMRIIGKYKIDGSYLPFDASVKVIVEEKGKIRTQVVKAKVGPFPLPKPILNQITKRIDKLLKQQLKAYADDVVIESIEIANGKMIIKGHVP